jgi:ParB family chromosome partitioning protein
LEVDPYREILLEIKLSWLTREFNWKSIRIEKSLTDIYLYYVIIIHITNRTRSAHMDIINIAMDLIDEDTDQPRYQFDETSLQELMNSINELGLLSPIKVRTMPNGRYTIIYGNRRYKASRMLGRPTIPCIVSNVTDEVEIYLEQIAENLTREGFSPIEEAEAFNKLLNDPKFSSSTKYLSSKLGKPESYIKNKCELLKFGNNVKKLVVSGTEIRKDKLTEDQLLPLKDLALEHRDPLAMIIARDELAVSDVKKIARLFKDNGISAGTKDKLLYKSGRDLVETWSVYEQNKAERAKPKEPKEVKEPKITATVENNNSVDGTSNSAEGSATTGASESSSSPETTSDLSAPVSTSDSTKPVTASQSAAPVTIEQKLQQLLASLPEPNPLPPEIMYSPEEMSLSNPESFMNGVNTLIDSLEKHLTDWHKVRELAKVQNYSK